jgi:hypothetical protein
MIRTATACFLCATVAALAHATSFQGAKDTPAKKLHDEALRKELLKMVEEDQQARKPLRGTGKPDPAVIRKMEAVDRKNTARLKEIIDRHGWPGRTLVGDKGANAAWLLAQHADRDLPFQKRCLALLKKAVPAGEAAGQHLAYLTDRVLVAEGKKQLYGTQFRTVDGKFEPSPIEDEANVDRRRKEVGLPTLAEYRKVLEKFYRTKPDEKKK